MRKPTTVDRMIKCFSRGVDEVICYNYTAIVADCPPLDFVVTSSQLSSIFPRLNREPDIVLQYHQALWLTSILLAYDTALLAYPEDDTTSPNV